MLIAQITDSHIVPPGTHWKNEPRADTAGRLSRAVAFLNGLQPRPDVVLFTGDAVERGDGASYQFFRELVRPLQMPLFVTPGNHDDREEMRKCFADQSYMPFRGRLNYSIEQFPVRLIGLDTHVEGEDYGKVCEERLSWLEETLRKDPAKPSLLFMHHPPAKVGVKAFDANYACFVAPGFEELIRKSDSLLGIVAGHYHILCASTVGGKGCFLAPSLAPYPYFAHPDDPRPAALELDDPAVTLHSYLGGSSLATHVVRLKDDYKRVYFR
jgi:3',5'-cyclic AMP phosphodiesterase CpdA